MSLLSNVERKKSKSSIASSGKWHRNSHSHTRRAVFKVKHPNVLKSKWPRRKWLHSLEKITLTASTSTLRRRRRFFFARTRLHSLDSTKFRFQMIDEENWRSNLCWPLPSRSDKITLLYLRVHKSIGPRQMVARRVNTMNLRMVKKKLKLIFTFSELSYRKCNFILCRYYYWWFH